MKKLIKYVWIMSMTLITLIIIALSINTSQAATITVDTTADIVNSGNSDGACSLREAIISANEDVSMDTCTAGNGDDTIVLGEGEYMLSITGVDEDSSLTGDLDILNTLSIEGSGQAIINANEIDRVIHILNSPTTPNLTVTINNLTVTGGYLESNVHGGGINVGSSTSVTINNSAIIDNFSWGYGGGILINSKGSANIIESYINNNVGRWGGGGIHINSNGSANIIESTINHNATSYLGGGIRIDHNGSANIVNSTVNANNSLTYNTDKGGGISVSGFVNVHNSSIEGNKARYVGAGIQITSMGIANITNSTINNNALTFDWSDGGGVSTDYLSILNITDSIISGNSSGKTAGGLLLDSENTASIVNSIISNNDSEYGGGLLINSPVNILDSTIYNNTATGSGAGMYMYNRSYIGEVNIFNSAISNNTTAGPGGGIYQAYDGTLNIHNSTISENQADDGGGLFLERSAMVNIQNSTIAHNSASTYGGGISSQDSSINIGGSIISNNTAPTSGADCYVSSTTLTSLGYNIVNDVSSGGCTFASTGDQTGVDPLLGSLADNGGRTKTHALLEGSPAIDAGNPACTGGTDQRGASRPVDGNASGTATCDIGAYEYLGSPPDRGIVSISESLMTFAALNPSGYSDSTITITNDGIGPLAIGTVGDTDPLAAPFSIVADECSDQSLASGETCDITVRFEPSTIAATATGLGSLGIVMLGVVLGSGISRRRKTLALLLIGAVIAISLLTTCGSSSTSDPITASDTFNIPTNDADNSNITINVSGSY